MAALAQRRVRAPDHDAESAVLRRLSAALADSPDGILHELTRQILVLCDAESAGVSLLRDDGEDGFYWPAIAGAWAAFENGGMPRAASPCGHVLDEDASLLFIDPVKDFPAIEGVEPAIDEVLLAPFHVEGRPIGTLWALHHGGRKRFDDEDRRRLESVADFVGSAWPAIGGSRPAGAHDARPADAAWQAGRLEALHALGILDTPPEPEFDGIVQLACRICDAPVALVSLVDRNRQWFKARLGFDACETPIDQSVCAHTIRQDRLLVIPDLTRDARTRDNPLVTGPPHIRFYAGAVLRTSGGQALGALCVIDGAPRPRGLSAEQADSLVLLARQTVALIELRRAVGLRDTALVDQHRQATDVTERLRAAEARMRNAQNAAQLGAFEIGVGDDRLFATEQFARIFGLPPQPSYDADDVRSMVLDADRSVVSSPANLTDGSMPPTSEYRIRRRSDGALRWILRRSSFEVDADGRPRRLVGMVEDITERKMAEARGLALLALGDSLREARSAADATAEAARVLGETLGAFRAGYAVADPAGRRFAVKGVWPRPHEQPAGTHYTAEQFPRTTARLRAGEVVAVGNIPAADWLDQERDAHAVMGTMAMLAVPMLRRGALEGVLFAHSAQPRTWTAEEVAFATAVADRTHATVARLQAQADQHVLNLELSHRMKNTMAVVQSIAQLTLRQATDADALRDFDHRLTSLGRAHEVLLKQSWQSARLRDIVGAAADLHGFEARLDLDGPDIGLNAKSALALSLLLHELSTNAAKHGALSNDTGRVRVGWSVRDVAGTARLHFVWRESGGPPVSPPARRGFGSRLLAAGLDGTGASKLTYESCGLVAEFTAPLSQVADG